MMASVCWLCVYGAERRLVPVLTLQCPFISKWIGMEGFTDYVGMSLIDLSLWLDLAAIVRMNRSQ